MISAGIDLAAEAATTAVAVIQWEGEGGVLTDLQLGVDDQRIRAVVAASDMTGVDCPFGWPDSFVSFVADHRAGVLRPPAAPDKAWRRTMTLRATDIHVHQRTGLTPLSVSADRIGHAALRWTALMAQLQSGGVNCARDGSGRVAEVYPAAALKLWGLPFRGYKGRESLAARTALVQTLVEATPQLQWGDHVVACVESHDSLDAVIAALVAREVAQGRTEGPGDLTSAATEGWIHLPATPASEPRS